MATSEKKIGILVVGIGGNNGVTLLAGHLANNQRLSWETASAGRVSAPNWNGCITQLKPKGGGVGFKGRYELADATTAAIGGWDIRPPPLGDALYASRVLDYDLVRQVRDTMNGMPVLKGVYDASFLGESQHATATHIVDPSLSLLNKVEHLRKDIREFKKTNNIDGHTTVVWSASVERPSITDFQSVDVLLEAILNNAGAFDISPSMLYAVASALEGCSFVNGGSQNTLSPAMSELYEQSYRSSGGSVLAQFDTVSSEPCYLLGTDFKVSVAGVDIVCLLQVHHRWVAHLSDS